MKAKYLYMFLAFTVAFQGLRAVTSTESYKMIEVAEVSELVDQPEATTSSSDTSAAADLPAVATGNSASAAAATP